MMDATAMLWVRKQVKIAERKKLVALCGELRNAQAKIAPMIAESIARRNAAMRQDGDHGFVMVCK